MKTWTRKMKVGSVAHKVVMENGGVDLFAALIGVSSRQVYNYMAAGNFKEGNVYKINYHTGYSIEYLEGRKINE